MFQPDGVRRQGGMNATPARVWNTGTCRTGVWRKPRREKSHVARTTRAKVPRQCTGAEPPGGAMKPGNAGRAKGWRQSTCQRANAERKSHKCRLDDGSRMRRETHVRFYEGLRVQFPRSTHLRGRSGNWPSYRDGPTTKTHNHTTTLWYDKLMPELVRFLGIIIRMYAEPSAPHHRAHFHAYYQHAVGIYSIDPIE